MTALRDSSKSSYYNGDDRYTSAVSDLNLHFHFYVLKVVNLLCFFFCYPCIKRASYTDNEAQPSLLFQNYNISSIIIITIIIIIVFILFYLFTIIF